MLTDKERFEKVWKQFCDFYQKHGCKGMDELWGGYFREESDIVFHLARLCAETFGLGYIHLNSPISTFYFSNYPSLKEREKKAKRQYIDIDITNPNTFSRKMQNMGFSWKLNGYTKTL